MSPPSTSPFKVIKTSPGSDAWHGLRKRREGLGETGRTENRGSKDMRDRTGGIGGEKGGLTGGKACEQKKDWEEQEKDLKFSK